MKTMTLAVTLALAAASALAASPADAAKQRMEQAWIAYRDAMCDYRALGSLGSSSDLSVVGRCRVDMDAMHAKELETLAAACKDGDLLCPPGAKR